MTHPDAQDESAAGDQVERQRALRQQHRVLDLDGQDAGAHLDGVDLPQRDREDGQQVGLVGHLRNPHPPEPLVAQLGEVLHAGVDR